MSLFCLQYNAKGAIKRQSLDFGPKRVQVRSSKMDASSKLLAKSFVRMFLEVWVI